MVGGEREHKCLCASVAVSYIKSLGKTDSRFRTKVIGYRCYKNRNTAHLHLGGGGR